MINDRLDLVKLKFSNKLKSKICKLSRGVDTNIFKKKNIRRESIIKKYGIFNNEKIIFFCGRIHELKGAVFLSKIHKLLSKKINVVSIFAGENIHGEKCTKIGGNRIKLIGHITENEVCELYNLCDLFVFPSKYEIGPQVVLEAKACGAICVVSPQGGGKRIYRNGIDGIVIKKFDPKQWESEIIKLLNDEKKREFMKKQILTKFSPPSWREIFDKYFTEKWNKILK